jgi:hypothetical protein
LRIFANAFLVAFALEALFTIASSQVGEQVGGQGAGLSAARGLFTSLVSVASLPLFILMGLSPDLRWRIFLPPCLLLSWLAAGAMPLPIWLSAADARLLIGVLEALLAVVAFGFCRQQNGGEGWLLRQDAMLGPAFSGRTAVGFSVLNLFVILPVSIAYLALSAAAGIAHLTAGFVELRADGIHLSHREYARDGERIHLVAMMHVGEPAFYRELFDSLPSEGAITLTEGVRDEGGLLSDGLDYGNVAAGLGLVVQPEFDGTGRELRNADIDVSQFSAPTLELLAGVAKVFAAESFGKAFRAYAELSDMSSEDAARALATLKHDLLDLRNDHLVGELEAALGHYDVVVVPWGALHLPGIEERVLALGFEQVDAADRRVVIW